MTRSKKKAAPVRAAINFKVSPEVGALLDSLQSRLDTSKTSVFRRSLALLERCLDHIDKGGSVELELKGKRSAIEFL